MENNDLTYIQIVYNKISFREVSKLQIKSSYGTISDFIRNVHFISLY